MIIATSVLVSLVLFTDAIYVYGLYNRLYRVVPGQSAVQCWAATPVELQPY